MRVKVVKNIRMRLFITSVIIAFADPAFHNSPAQSGIASKMKIEVDLHHFAYDRKRFDENFVTRQILYLIVQ
ncbi:MAG: hypothetical protein A2048_10700 [Deltaproteobacteria bacterium GWA2_45_12]|nr:MAG: hypothetical protein A2048_10700 [Deltaproteobacteria bacterium GWA2_45_12]